MKRIAIVLVILFSLLSMPSPASAAGIDIKGTSGDGEWIDNTWKVSLYPNEAKFREIKLYNSSSGSLEVWATVLPDSLDNGNLTFELDKTNFVLPSKNEAYITLTAKASGSATPDSYTTKLEIKSEVPPAPAPPPPTGGGGPPTYSVKTDLFGKAKTFYTDRKGGVQRTIEATSEDGMLTMTIPKGTIALGEDGKRLKSLEAAVDEGPPDPPEDANIIGLAYDFGPDGATFAPPLTLEYTYDPADIPEGVAEEDLVLAYYDEDAGTWVELDCVVDTENNTITASVSHFTTLAIIARAAPVPPEEEVVLPPEEEIVLPPEEEVVPPEEEIVPPPPVAPPEEEVVPVKPTNWPLIGAIIVAVVLVGLLIYFLVRRRAYLKIKGWL